MWYTECMNDKVELITTPDIVPTIKRLIAASLATHGEKAVPYEPDAFRDTKNKDILATILWDIVTVGKGLLADGTEIAPESYADWLSTVKYLVTHLDGPVGTEGEMGTNVFKVYVGVNVENI